MYGDPGVIRSLATDLRDEAIELRAEAGRLVAHAADARWVGLSADRMRERVGEKAADLRDHATRLDDAAEKMDAHAQEVEELLALIAAIQTKVKNLIAGAIDRLQDVGNALLDAGKDLLSGKNPLDDLLANFSPPPDGHKDWLDVPDQLPGVKL